VGYRAVPKRNAHVVTKEIVRAGRNVAGIDLDVLGEGRTIVLGVRDENIQDVGVCGAMAGIELADVHITAQV